MEHKRYHYVWNSGLVAGFLLFFKALTFAQWQPDQRLTFNDSSSQTSGSNTWSIASGPGALVHVVWYDNREGANKIYYKRSADSGITWDSTDTRLTNSLNGSFDPTVSVSDSVVHVAWVDGRAGNLEIYYKDSTNGGSSWSQDTCLSYNPVYSHNPSIASFGSDVYVVWENTQTNEDIYFRRSTDKGVSWGPETRLTFSDSVSFGPAIAVSGSNVHVVWTDGRYGNNNYEIFYKLSTDRGLTWDPDTRISFAPGESRNPSIAISGSLVYVVWRDTRNMSNDLYYARSTDSGVTWSPDSRLIYAPNDRRDPSVSAFGSNVHVVWDDSRDNYNEEIYYKRSTNGGLNWEPDIRLTSAPNLSRHPSIVVSGPVLHVVWYDRRDGNDEIYYKRNPTGNLGVEDVSKPNSFQLPSFRVLPNPFLSYASVPGHERERFVLYDISGRLVGIYRGDRIGSSVPPGVYFIRALGKDSAPLSVVKLR